MFLIFRDLLGRIFTKNCHEFNIYGILKFGDQEGIQGIKIFVLHYSTTFDMDTSEGWRSLSENRMFLMLHF